MPTKHRLEITYRSVGELIPYARNAKIHDDANVALIAGSIKEFGFNNPVLLDGGNGIIAGHGRVLAARRLGMAQVPCVELKDLTEAEKRAYILADNKLAERSPWDTEALGIELGDLSGMGVDLGALGFTDDEIAGLVGRDAPAVDDDGGPAVGDAPERCNAGDIWELGAHRLMCGDSTDAAPVGRLMGGELADMVFTDPPYNVDYAGKNRFLNAIAPGNRIQDDIKGDKAESDEAVGRDLWLPAFRNMRSHAAEYCSIYVTMPQGGAHMMMMMKMAQEAGWQVKHELVWVKNNHVLGRADYNYRHEPIMYGWGDKHKFYGGGRFKTSVWEIDKPAKSELHPTMKPVPLVVEALLNSSSSGQVILDLFGGSGTTLIACEQEGRRCRMMEIDPHYCDVIIARWEKATGGKARRVDGA